ncbi:MFS transporter [candidate division KSB1 bacterium]|nr:MFS transporter [candidate division KSB1 bacterium]
MRKPRSKLPQSFWVANTMEIFERLAWYGFFAVSSLYITGSRAEGALGFTSEQRGMLQGVVPFILYLLPVVFGALGDRFGYKKTFLVAYTLLVPAYYLLGQFSAFGTFFMAFLFVAVGAAIFKPVVVGTVARTTDETNSSMGFGIFYMMVNVGGFVGPIVAGIVRVRYGWDWVFIASSFWIACNFIWLLLFYKEPTTEAGSAQKRSIKQVLSGIVEVLGNGRFFLMIFVLLTLLAISGRYISWNQMLIVAAVWVVLNVLLDIPLRARATGKPGGFWLTQPLKLGNWKFALYLLILSGFWTSFNQIFLTMPEYIRDFVETRDMVNTARNWVGEDFAREFAAVNEDLLAAEIHKFAAEQPAVRATEPESPGVIFVSDDQATKFRRTMFDFKVRVPESDIKSSVSNLNPHPVGGGKWGEDSTQVRALAHTWAESYRQVNPEYIINIDAGAIVIFQVLVSFLIGFFPPLSVMVVGILVSAVGIGMSAWLATGWLVTLAITIFAFGEMIASPKSQEYVGRIAPQQKVAMYMGFYFWTVALGNIFGGRLSGELYGSLARDQGRPDLMWMIFGGLAVLTAIVLVIYDRLILRRGNPE